MKKPFAAIATAALAVGLGLGLGVTAPPPATAAPYCGITWGSAAKTRAIESTAQITGVRTGRHTCFDRMVVDLRYKVKGYDVRYGRVYTEGQGEYVPLTGTDIRIIVKARTYTDSGRATYAPADWDHVADVDDHRTFRQVAYAGSFEGQTTFGLGVRARLPMRVMILDGPGTGSRLVIDVAHRW
ncbi:hypothetical protein [Micrococcus sp. TA1]|uniref:AMIN-like domain-containing (lipo)protein n=1 Tax=Micrococcus sp. TA1 TaxID=681627 RepID=UPI001613AC60|nr:hypothetical protein [Micrococcus sp. TA1]MBB5749607.1 hypothetical protein [Micrococcus sp. TA1]